MPRDSQPQEAAPGAPSHARDILVLAPNWLGDAAMATPIFPALRRRYPSARITVAGRSAICALLDGLPEIDRFETLPPRPGLGAMIRAAWRFRKPDIAVILPHSFRAALFARLTGARVRLGVDRGGRRLLLTHPVAPQRVNGRITPVYMTEEYLGVLGPIGAPDPGGGLTLRADPRLLADMVEQLPRSEGPVVGFAPGAAFGPSKRWPAERYAAVARRLAQEWDARLVLLTGPGEEDTRRAVLDAADVPFVEPLPGAPGVAALKAAIASLDLLIGNDSGPRHVAVAFGVPVVCIMGPTWPAYSCGPYERGAVLRKEVYCGPCQQPHCATDHRCMTRVTVDEVVEVAARWLPTRGPGVS